MQIVYFSTKEQFLAEMENRAGEKLFVAPSPAKADGLRTRVSSSQHDVITIAKFTSNLVNELWIGEEKPVVKRKSELLLIFGILKNKYLPELGFEQFTQAYNLFSDLRSFTLNEETLTSVLDEQPEIIRNAVKLFWKLLEVTGFHDEHGAYQQITERLRSHDEIEGLKKNYIFWGFQHLNGQQVDLLKALAIRYQVIIPFPLSLKPKLKKSDWPSWLQDSKTTEVLLEEIEGSPKADWIQVNSRELSFKLKTLVKKNDQIILGVSKLAPVHMDIIPSRETNFKIPHQLVSSELKATAKELKSFQGNSQELEAWFVDHLKQSPSLKHYRARELYLEALKSVSDMTDELFEVDHFFLKLLSEVVNLNQPRTSFIPTSSGEMSIDLKDMSTLEDIDRKRRVIVCIDERFDDIQGLGQNYTETIQKALSALGPLKRNELELLFRQWEFKDLFSSSKVLVLMSEGTLKHSLIWKRLFQDIELNKTESELNLAIRRLKDHFQSVPKKTFAGTFSASKIQTFIDCPRKFYFNYVDRIVPEIVLEKDFDPMTSGTIIHEIIEEYFKRKLSDAELKPLTIEITNKYIVKNKLKLPLEVKLQREMIFHHRSLNGIQFIRALEEKSKDKINWQIELPFKYTGDFSMNGRMDCVGIGEKYIFLLDFKSTSSASATTKEVVSYDKIQLWAYAMASKNLIPDFSKKTLVLGYVVLEDPADSSLFTSDDELVAANKESRLCMVHKFKDELDQKLKESEETMVKLTLAINAENSFVAKPRDKSICTFCDLNKICVKSEVNDVSLT